jgi:O-antigen ligase
LLLFAYLVRRRNSGKENSSEGVFVSTPLGLPLGALLVALPVFALYGLLLGHPLQYAVGYYEWRCIFIAILFYFLVTSIFQEYRDLRKLWRWFFLIASAKALYSLVLVITNISPPLPLVFGQGPVDEGPEIIMYLFAALQAGAILAFHAEKNREWRAILLAGALIMVADVALSQKRTPQLGFLIGLAVLGWYLPRREKTRWVLGAALLALLIASSGVLASRGSTDSGIAASFSRYNEVMEFVHAPGVSTSGGGTFPFHVFDLIDGWEKIKEAPLLGQGFGGQSERNLSLALLHEGRDFTTGFIHNQYLTFWLKMGVTGPILMVWLLGGFLLHCSRKMKRISKTFASATVIGIYAAICADIAMEFWGASWIGNTKTPIVVFLSMALAIGFLRCCSDGARFPSPSRIAVTPHSGVGGHFREH